VAERTCKIGHEIVAIPDSEANYWHVSIVNHYWAGIGRSEQTEISELENRLVINDELAGPVVNVRVNRNDCLRLAQMFLDAAMHDTWRKITAGRAHAPEARS
jgi:hypothetical protein